MPTTKHNNSPSTLKRFGLIVQLIELEETEDIKEQINRLVKEDLDETAINIIELLNAGQYQEAVIKINGLIKNSAGIKLYENPEMEL